MFLLRPSRIIKFTFTTRTLKKISSFGGSGKGRFKLYIPEDLDIDEEDNVYVANTENGRITVFASSGAPFFESEPVYHGITSVEIINSYILAADAFHNLVRVLKYQSNISIILS